MFVRALYTYDGRDTGSLSFQAGDILEVGDTLESGWWDGQLINGPRGWFPSNYIVRVSDEEAMWAIEQAEAMRQQPSNLTSIDDDPYGRGRLNSISSQVQPADSSAQLELEQELWASLSGNGPAGGFSQGGDIFAEIAAASSGPQEQPPAIMQRSISVNSRGVPDINELARVAARHSPQHSTSSTSSSNKSRASNWEESDFWEPKLNDSGQIYYLNSRTGQTSMDPPKEHAAPSRGSLSAGSDASTDTQQSMSAAFYNNLSLASQTADRSTLTGATSVPADGWVARKTDGDQQYFENIQTGETRWTPPATSSSSSGSMPSDPDSRSRAGSAAGSLLEQRLHKRSTIVPNQPPNGKHVPHALSTDTSRMSFYSDESSLDAGLTASKRHQQQEFIAQRKPPTPRVSALNREETPSRRGTTGSDNQFFPPELDFLDPQTSSLASLETVIRKAAEELIVLARPSDDSQQHAPETDEQFDYDKAASLTAELVAQAKQLLHCTGALDLAVRSSSNQKTSPAPDESRAALLRPYTKKITSPLNKLVLESRALWGLMNTTEEEETVIQEAYLQNVENEDDLLLYRENRAQILKLRAESELQLRLDVAIKAQEIVKAVSVFCVFVSDLPPDALGPSSSASNLPALVRRPEGVLNSSVAALLGPGNGYGANWRGNGFVILPPQSITSIVNTSASAPVPSVRYNYPTTEFDPKAAAAIDMENQTALEEVSSLRGAIAGLLSNNSRNRLSQASVASDVSSGSNTGVLPPTPLQSAQKHVSRIANHALQLNSSLGRILLLLDELKIAARLDLEIDPSTMSALLAYAEAEASRKSKDSKTSAADDEESLEYNATLLKAQQLLAEFEQAKQVLYDSGPELVLAVQSIAMSEVGDTATAKQSSSTPSPSQPRFSAPLEEFRFPQRQNDPLAAILATLRKVDSSITSVKEALITLLAVAETQSQAPQETRRVSTQQRAKIEGQRLSQLSFNTFVSKNSSGQGTITAPNGSQREASDDSGSQEIVVPSSIAPSGQSSAASSYFFPSPSLNDTQHTASSSTSRSYPSSLSSFERSQKERLEEAAQGPNVFAAAAVSGSPDSNDYLDDSPALRSPHQQNRSKLRKFFGDDAPAPGQRSDGSTSKPDKLRKLLGDDAPPPGAMARKGSPVAPQEETPLFLRLDHIEELSLGVDGQIKGGTLRALVAKLTAHTSVDHAFISNFLMTYPTFVSSHDLFQQLVDRYQITAPESLSAEQFKLWMARKQKLVRIRTVNVIKLWLESYLMEEDCEPLLMEIHNFAMSGLSDTAATQQILRVVDKRRRNGVPRRTPAANATSAPAPIVPRKMSAKTKFLDLDPLEIARQLTIMDSRLCMRITTEECLSKAWPKVIKNDCKNITAMIAFNNATTHWVQETILTQDDTKKRASTIKQFIIVAERCHKLQNFAGLIDIVAGLTATPISRLRRTWELLNQRHQQTLDSLNQLMSPTKHFAKYWEELKRAGPPCVPFLGVFLTSWTFIGDGMADFVRDSPEQINYAKRAKAAELMQQIELHQSTSYNLTPVQSLVDYLEGCFRSEVTPSTLWEMSLRIEPRERDDEKIARVSTLRPSTRGGLAAADMILSF